MGNIKILSPSVAKRIAAGEVIDRPYSVVRELLDNSIDAKASQIVLDIVEGGINLIKVSDNGHGMSKDDLFKSIESHATSKINNLSDFSKLQTLGFRGEALASIAACSKLTITSKTKDSTGYRILSEDSKIIDSGETSANTGTTIEVKEIFYNIPARRKFLKSTSAETRAVNEAFLEKAIPFNDIEFKLFSNDKLRYFLPQSSMKARLANAYPNLIDEKLLFELEQKYENFEVKILGYSPNFYRRDRKYIKIFTNNRMIVDFGLAQAAEYGYRHSLPGGSFPICFIFLKVNPEFVDFNVHPAKKEIKLMHKREIHHAISSMLSNYFLNKQRKQSSSNDFTIDEDLFLDFKEELNTRNISDKALDNALGKVLDKSQDKSQEFAKQRDYNFDYNLQQDNIRTESIEKQIFDTTNKYLNIENDAEGFKYLGQIMNLFLLVEANNALYLIDQHAADERYFYDKFSQDIKEQNLLIPYKLDLDYSSRKFLEENKAIFDELKIKIKEVNEEFFIFSLPSVFSGDEKFIEDFITSEQPITSNLKKEFFSNMACKYAVKDGDVLTPNAAIDLIKRTFKLEDKFCPHGRPIWHILTKQHLFKLFKRIV